MTSPEIPDWARRAPRSPARNDTPAGAAERRPLRIVVVGPCAAGKSTLTEALRAEGYEALACAQEHSEIPHLWALSEPDVLIALSVSLEAIRQRRGDPTWPATIYTQQLRRLQQAVAHCQLAIDTSQRTPEEVLALARTGIRAEAAKRLDR